MDIYDNTNVLDEVESLFNKLESSSESTKHGVFSKIQENVPNQAGKHTFLPAKKQIFKSGDDKENFENDIEEFVDKVTSGDTFPSNKDNVQVGKKKDDFSSVVGEITDKVNGLSFIDDITERSRSTRSMHCRSWEDDEGMEDTLETLHEMLFPDENDKLLEDSYPWNDHAYENKSNLNFTNIAHNVEDENEWFFEGFPISSCPSNFHTYSNISAKWTGSRSDVSNKAIEKNSTCVTVDPLKKPFVCIECKRCFPDVYYLNLHLKRHKGEKQFLCDHCPYMIYDKNELQRHIQRVHLKTKSFLCEYCGRLFAEMVNLKQHIKKVHFQREIIICDQCSYKTYSRLTLRKHVLRVHQFQRYLLQCPVCGLKTKGRINLLNHIKTHTEHKPYSCDVCNKSFALKKRLSAHKKTVHQTRPFECEVCYKRFQSKFHLERHLTIHFKNRPFPCPFCLYASNTHGNLNKHVRSIHQKKDFSIKMMKGRQFIDQVNIGCVDKGNDITEKYLNDLSKVVGEDITVKSLQEKRLVHEMAREVELLKSKNISKNLQAVDHSYSEKFDSETGPNEVVLLKTYPLIMTDHTELPFSLPTEHEIQVTVSKTDFERSLQAHYQRVQEVLHSSMSDKQSSKSDHLLSSGDHILSTV